MSFNPFHKLRDNIEAIRIALAYQPGDVLSAFIKAPWRSAPKFTKKEHTMNNSIYTINKGINKRIEFHGLRAQYIWYFAGLVLALMILFAALYIIGAGTIICLAVCGPVALFGAMKIFALSRRYGEHGLMKAMARKRVPRVLKSYGRRFFQQLTYKENLL